MGDAEKNETTSGTPGTRNRTIGLEPLQIGYQYHLNSDIHFDNFILKFIGSGTPNVSKVNLALGNVNPPLALNQMSGPWELTFRMTVKANTEKHELLFEDEFTLSSSCNQVNVDCAKFQDRMVEINFEFLRVNGLGVKPLQDYAVANNYSDIIFIVEEQRFHLNRAFLASHSPVFEKLITTEYFAEKNKNELELKEVAPATFTELLDIMSNPSHRLYTKASVLDVLRLADKYDVSSVIKSLENMLLSEAESFRFKKGELLWMAEKYGMKMLLMKTLSDWQKGDARYITDEMWNDFDSARSLVLFKSLA